MGLKFTDLPASSGYAATDVFAVTDDPSGTAASQKMTGTQLNAGLVHNSLASKQGGTTSQYYHLTAAMEGGLTGLTANTIGKMNAGETALVDSIITDDGSTATVGGGIAATTGTFTDSISLGITGVDAQPYIIKNWGVVGGGSYLSVQGQDSGKDSGIVMFTKDGDGTDANLIEIFGYGQENDITTLRERLLIGWDDTNSRYQIQSEQAGRTLRPIHIFTSGNASQIVANIDGSVAMSGSLLVGGTGTPTTSSILDITSTTKGALLPRMTTGQRDAITSPAEGLIIYNLTTHVLNFHNGTSWGAV